MPCYHPLKAMRSSNGVQVLPADAVVFNLRLPCGRCVGCRLERSRVWALRCVHEASLHENNCFVTLTYDDAHVPEDNGLHHRDFQLFMKRLRKRFPHIPVRYYMAGEYGGQFGRPHFHIILFGFCFSDLYFWKRTKAGRRLYRSPTLESLWTDGYSSVGTVTFESAAYVARYIMDKVTGDEAERAYEAVSRETGEIFSRRPEYNSMSLKPGIGAKWFEKFHADVYPHDRVVYDGVESRVPRYYDKLMARKDQALIDDLKEKRMLDAMKKTADNTPERLAAKETVVLATKSLLKRGFTN